MPGQMLWGWYPEDDKWVKLRVDVDGSFHVVGYIDNIDDIGDVDAAGAAEGDMLYYDAASGHWMRVTLIALAVLLANEAILSDLADINIAGIVDGDILYWDDAAEEWKVVAHFADADAHHTEDHKDRHDPIDGDDKLDTAAPVTVAAANVIGNSHSFSRANHVHEREHAKYTNNEAVSAVEAAGLALASGKNIKIIQALGTNFDWSGLTAVMTAGTDLLIVQAVYVGGDGKMEKAIATGAATMPCIALAMGTIDDNATGEFLLQGYYREDGFSWTHGGILYVSKDTPGLMTQTLPAATGEQVQVVGIAITDKIIYFNPSYELVEIS